MRHLSFAGAMLALCANIAAAQTVPASSIGSGTLTTAISRALAAERSSSVSSVQGSGSSARGWNVGIYPILLWVPTGIDIKLELPPDSGGDAGEIIDGRFDGAYLGGGYVSSGWFRVDADGVWAAIGGDRDQIPTLSVDADLIYFHLTGGVRLAPGLYATAGVRRLALKYKVRLATFPEFERKPGFWDPLIGIAYHYEGEGRPLEFHAWFEGGGFGAGADQDYGLMARVDWKPIRHFGLTGGYNFLYFKATDTVLNRDFTVRQSVHGPVLGIGFYF